MMMSMWSWKVSIPTVSMSSWNQTQPMERCASAFVALYTAAAYTFLRRGQGPLMLTWKHETAGTCALLWTLSLNLTFALYASPLPMQDLSTTLFSSSWHIRLLTLIVVWITYYHCGSSGHHHHLQCSVSYRDCIHYITHLLPVEDLWRFRWTHYAQPVVKCMILRYNA